MDINALLDGISAEDMEKLKSTAMQILGGEQKKEESKSDLSVLGGFDPKMLETAAKFSSMLKEKDDKSEFLLALRPMLTPERRKKAEEAAMMLKFLHIVNRLKGETGHES